MKKGDMVRFRNVLDHRAQELSEWKYGVVAKEYHTWEEIVSILHEGDIIRVRSSHVQIHQRGAEKR